MYDPRATVSCSEAGQHKDPDVVTYLVDNQSVWGIRYSKSRYYLGTYLDVLGRYLPDLSPKFRYLPDLLDSGTQVLK